MSSDSNSDYKFYHYVPSLAGACVFIVVFGILTIWHAALIAKHRTWYFVPLLVGGVFEFVGYLARAISNRQHPNPTIGPYVIQTLLLLVAPALFAASIYMILGRIILSVDGERYSLIKKRWLTKVFVTSDVLSFIIQLGGGGLMASSHAATAKLGSHIILAGLLLQIVLFGFFVVIALMFHRRLRANPTVLSCNPSIPWEKFMWILYLTSGFIMVRSIVRVAEFLEGFEGNIIRHEVYLYCFDAVPMAAVVAIFNICYPAHFSTRAAKATVEAEQSAGSDVELAAVEPQVK